MGEALVVRYWCHMCSRMVSPVMMEVELKCPFCDGGFVEEMDGRGAELDAAAVAAVDIGSDRALSLWAPILLGMMGGPSRRRRFQLEEEDEDPQQDRDLMSLLRRRRRSSAILQLLQSLEDGIQADNPDGERERERVILINPFRQAVILGSTSSGSVGEGSGGGSAPLGDYYVGAGLDLLLQHLAENDPNRYGTPPARREAVDALPTVKVEGGMSCSVCLEDLEDGAEAREMPCKHRFHNGCIVQWLELHSTCPICRFQLPADESKNSGGGGGERAEDVGDGGVNGRRFWVPVPWPFNGLFSFSGSQSGGGSGSSSSSAAPPPNDSHGNEN